ncbi:MAG TPA: DEAD/DEAH box helicase, partial [Nannocystaceae bacterium]|nr:DEAD/DEAH box helicase [Nannocystaceae bacterium]
ERDLYLRARGVDLELGCIFFHLAERPGDRRRPFAFLATVARYRGEDGRLRHLPLGAALADQRELAAQEKLLAPLRQAAEGLPRLRQLLDTHELFHPVAWTAEEAHALLTIAPVLEAAGVRLRLPAFWVQERPRPQIRAEIGGNAPGALGLRALLDFKLRYFIGDTELTADEWRELVSGAAGLRHVGGRWVEFDPARHEEALRHWERIEAAASRGQVGFVEGMRLCSGLPRGDLDGEVDPPTWAVTAPGPWLARTLAELQSPSGSPDADPGPALRGELRPYQRDGVSWLWLLTRLGVGGCLADDMGLGKTIQVISLLLLLQRQQEPGPHLIVLPASLLANWRSELERFGPSLRVHIAHRSAGDIDQAPDLAEVDVVLTTYATLVRQPWLHDREWGLLVLDEAQAIKNAATKQTRAVKSLNGRHRLILTGTPVENALTDLWSLFDFCNPGLLGGVTEFKTATRRLGQDPEGLAPLRALVRPYILRRLKSDRRVIADLPDKTEIPVYCGLTREQAALYAAAVAELAAEVTGAEGIRRRGVILAFLTRFKQICNHPAQAAHASDYEAELSGKFQRLRELCTSIAEAGERALVFTQFREICDPLADFLAGIFGRPGLVLHGGTPVAQRAGIVAEFQADEGPPFMVLSLKAGGTGLNLTAAAHVIHFDRWWNPAVENQATDRAYRIGQHKNVLVHKFVCRGTLEERIDAMLRDKQGIADGVLADDGERRLTELDTDELMRVVALDLRTALAEE